MDTIMSDRDYFIVILLMFVNLITTSFLGFRSSFVQAEIIALAILIIINLAFVLLFSRRLALAFFFISLLNMIFLFTIRQDFIFVLVSLVNVFILYYLTLVYASAPDMRTLSAEKDEDLFTELGLPTIEQMRQPENPVIFPTGSAANYFVEKKTAQESQDFVHIDELDLPDGKEDTSSRKYSYQLYYEEPRQDISFQPIDVLERRIEKKLSKKKR
jgi:hypothetical protein